MDLAMMIPLFIALPVAVYLLEKRLRKTWAAELARGRALERLVQERVESGDYEQFLASLFERYEWTQGAEERAQKEYDAARQELLRRADPTGLTFSESLDVWRRRHTTREEETRPAEESKFES